MGDTAHGATTRGGMDIHDQKSTFHHFLNISLWGTLVIIMSVALLTVALAMGFGWMAGVGAYAAIGVIAGLALGMRGSWWALVIGSTIVLGLGGLIGMVFG